MLANCDVIVTFLIYFQFGAFPEARFQTRDL